MPKSNFACWLLHLDLGFSHLSSKYIFQKWLPIFKAWFITYFAYSSCQQFHVFLIFNIFHGLSKNAVVHKLEKKKKIQTHSLQLFQPGIQHDTRLHPVALFKFNNGIYFQFQTMLQCLIQIFVVYQMYLFIIKICYQFSIFLIFILCAKNCSLLCFLCYSLKYPILTSNVYPFLSLFPVYLILLGVKSLTFFSYANLCVGSS